MGAMVVNGDGSREADGRRLAGLLAPMLDRVPAEQVRLDAAAWHALATRAVRERLGPLLHAALQRAGRADVPTAVQTLLAQEYCRAAAAALYQQQELAAILRACADAQIPCIVLKGSALAVTLYPDPALRPCGDIDLLFPPDTIPQVMAILDELGYQNRYHASRTDRLPRTTSEHHCSRAGRRPSIVEPHWHITGNAYYARRMPSAWFWQQTTPAMIGGEPTQVLATSAQFLHLVSHYALHYQGHHLLWLFDIALLVRHVPDWGWVALAGQARSFGLAQFARDVLNQVQRIWDVDLPRAGMAALAQTPTDFGERVAGWAMQRPGAPPWLLWQAVHTPSRRLRLQLLARLVLPSRTDARRFCRGEGRRSLASAYGRRLVQLPGELLTAGWALWRMRHP